MRLDVIQVNAASMRAGVADYRSVVAVTYCTVYRTFSSTSMNTNSKLFGLITSCSTPVWRA